MSSIKYNGNVVNSIVSDINSLSNEFSSLSNSIKSATNIIVSARGFQQYVGGISSDTFSGDVEKCGEAVKGLVNDIRQKQVEILSYSEDKDAINAFLDTLDRKDYAALDLSAIDDYIPLDKKIGNIFAGAGATAATAGLGLLEGLGEFAETGADLVTLAGTGVASIFTGVYDLLTGEHTTEKMWDETKTFVSDKKVESIFNSFYDDNPIGQAIKNNAYGFDTVRGVGSGLGYVGGLIGLNILTGGLASGLGIGAAGSIGAGQLALTGGLFGFSSGTENAWADGATTGKGLLYGAASGAWEGLQWFAGAKINQIGGLGDKVASGIFKGAAGGVGTRIGLDTIDSGLEGFVQPALSMIYKDYGEGNLLSNYKTAFQEAGGWGNVFTNALIGGIGSGVSEFVGARKLLKEAGDGVSEQAGKGGLALLDEDASAKGIFAGSSGKTALLDDDIYEAAKGLGSTPRTIDGDWVREADNIFNSKSKDINIPDSYKYFRDGSFLPDEKAISSGVLSKYEATVSADEMISLLDKNKKSLTATEYTRLRKATEIFKAEGLELNSNELKLIVNHSAGNTGRISDAIKLTTSGLSDAQLDSISKKLSDTVFQVRSPGKKIYKEITTRYIDALRANGVDDWSSSKEIYNGIKADKLFEAISDRDTSKYATRISKFFGGELADDTVRKLANCDGYYENVKNILNGDSKITEAFNLLDAKYKADYVDDLSVSVASKIFRNENLARYKAVNELTNNFNFNDAIKLTYGESTDLVGKHYNLFKAASSTNEKAVRFTYYSLLDGLKEQGYTEAVATQKAKEIYVAAMTEMGKDVDSNNVFRSKSNILNWNDNVVEVFNNDRFISSDGPIIPDYIKKNYTTTDGKIKGGKLLDDFQRIMAKQEQPNSAFFQRYKFDSSESTAAVKLFTQSYVDSAMDSTNPNQADSLRFISKILELDSQGKTVFVGSDNGISCSHSKTGQHTINLDRNTVWAKDSDTVFHEVGHTVFDTVLDAETPRNFDTIRKYAMDRLYSDNSQMALKYFAENSKEAGYYSDYVARKTFDNAVRKQGLDGIKGYKEKMIEKYSAMSLSDRNSTLRSRSSIGGGTFTGIYDKKIGPKLDFKDLSSVVDIEVNSMISKTSDKVFRNQFADYSVISGVIDSASQGDVRFTYGHGNNYFLNRFSGVNELTMHELVADYSSMKVTGKNRDIRFLRFVLGDELFDTVDATYKKMLK